MLAFIREPQNTWKKGASKDCKWLELLIRNVQIKNIAVDFWSIFLWAAGKLVWSVGLGAVPETFWRKRVALKIDFFLSQNPSHTSEEMNFHWNQGNFVVNSHSLEKTELNGSLKSLFAQSPLGDIFYLLYPFLYTRLNMATYFSEYSTDPQLNTIWNIPPIEEGLSQMWVKICPLLPQMA